MNKKAGVDIWQSLSNRVVNYALSLVKYSCVTIFGIIQHTIHVIIGRQLYRNIQFKIYFCI